MKTILENPLLKNQCYINGKWIGAKSGQVKWLRNPANNEVLVDIPQLSREEVKEAIHAASLAMVGWRELSGKQRSLYLRKWFDLVQAHRDDLASLIVFEEGKPFVEALAEVDYAASFIEWFAEEAKRVKGDVMAPPQAGSRIIVLKEPIGVCATITPWNFPAAMITRKIAPALAAGCTAVAKPAQQTPLTAFGLAFLAEKAGIPAGVFNVVTGKASDIGGEFTSNPIIKKISFTGSTEIGRHLIQQSAQTIKKVSMELGGNAPFIVFNDAYVEKAVEGLIATKFRNTGQACISANRVYVQEGIYDAFIQVLKDKVGKLKVGNGFDKTVQQGPLIDTSALEKVEEHIADALKKGANLVQGGKRHALGGLFFEPTILSGVTQNMLVCREETFGPIAPVIRFHSEADVVKMANDTEYGLAAYLFSKDAERIWRVSAAIESGMIGINTGAISNEVAPFGGIKESGLGREGSIYGMDEYLELKYLAWNGAGENKLKEGEN